MRSRKAVAKVRWKLYFLNRRLLPPILRSAYILDVYRRALRFYVPRKYAGPATIVKSDSRRFTPPLEWPHLIGGPLDVHEVSGGHMDLTKEPQVARWAVTLKEALDRVTTTPPALGRD